MRHARDDDLDRVDDLLSDLRALATLTERKRGNFLLRSRPFLHFHADGDDLFADVRLDGVTFERHRVTTAAERRALLARIRSAV